MSQTTSTNVALITSFILRKFAMNATIKQQLFGSLGIESAETLVDPELANVSEDDLPEENIEGETSVAEALEDTNSEETVDDIETQGEDLEDASESLEELDVAVESFRKSDTKLNPIESVALKLAVRQATRKFVKNVDSVVHAVESFKDDPEESTRLACEGIKEAAKSFKDGVVAAAKKAFEKLKEIVSAIINRFRGIESRANKVIVAAKKAGLKISGNISISKDSIAVSGDTSYDAILKGMEVFLSAATKLKDSTNIDATFKINMELHEGEGTIKYEEIVAHQNKFMIESFKDVWVDVTEKDGNYVGPNLPGNFIPKLVKGETKITFLYDVLEQVKPEKKSEDNSITAFQPNEIIQLATMVKAVQKAIAEFDGFLKRLARTMERITAVHVKDESRRETPEDVKKRSKEEIKDIHKVSMGIITKEMAFLSRVVFTGNNLSGVLLTACEKSISSAGKGGEEKKGEEPKKEEAKAEEAKA